MNRSSAPDAVASSACATRASPICPSAAAACRRAAGWSAPAIAVSFPTASRSPAIPAQRAAAVRTRKSESSSASRTAVRAAGDPIRNSANTAARARLVAPARASSALERRRRRIAGLHQQLGRAILHVRPRVVEQADQFGRRHRRQVQLFAARIGRAPRRLAADAVHAALHLRFGVLRQRAAVDEPRAGVEDQQAAVGVLENIRRMEIRIGRREEVGVLRAKRRAFPNHHVPLNAMRIELAP